MDFCVIYFLSGLITLGSDGAIMVEKREEEETRSSADWDDEIPNTKARDADVMM